MSASAEAKSAGRRTSTPKGADAVQRRSKRSAAEIEGRFCSMAIHLAGSCAGRQSLLPPLLLEIFVKVVEHLGATRDAIRVILGRYADPFDQCPDASDLRPAEFVILQVDVVDDFRDGAQRGVFWRAALQQHFECAFVALVGELGLEHVETQLAGVGRYPLPETNLKRACGSMK